VTHMSYVICHMSYVICHMYDMGPVAAAAAAVSHVITYHTVEYRHSTQRQPQRRAMSDGTFDAGRVPCARDGVGHQHGQGGEQRHLRSRIRCDMRWRMGGLSRCYSSDISI
jgi:hypothetical protein